MGKKSGSASRDGGGAADKKAKNGRAGHEKGMFNHVAIVLLGIAGVIVAVAAPWLSAQWNRADAADPKGTKAPATNKKGDISIVENKDLIARLLELLTEMEGLKGDDKLDERLAAGSRVAKELDAMEKEVDPTTPAGKQQMGLVNLVRSALDADREGRDMDTEWNDEAIAKQHGLTTYANKDYWENAYAAGKYSETFEWYGGWTEPDLEGRKLKDIIMPIVSTDGRILMLGAGNSNMSAMMYQDGYKQIINGDISAAVVEQMRDRYKHLQGMEYHVMDATALELDNESFDVVVEKGLLDALYAGTGAQVPLVLQEVSRVLKPGGQFLSITMQQEGDSRLVSIWNGGSVRGDDVAVGPALGSGGLECSRLGQQSFAARTQPEKEAPRAIHIYSCRWT